MACGTPVVCSDTSSLPEVVDGAALQIDPLDEVDWTEAMEQALYDEELRRKLVAWGLARGRRFSWERAAKDLLEICTELVA